MLSPGIVSLLLVAVTAAAVWAKFSWRSLIVSVVVLEVVGVGLLGLPGGAFLETLEPVMRRVGVDPISADGAWPSAILMSVVWPVALAPAYPAARPVQLSNGVRGLVALAVLATTSLLIGALVYSIAA